MNSGSASKSVLNWGQADVKDQFAAGNAAMMVNGPWQFPALDKVAGLKYDVVPIPVPRAGQAVVAPLGGETWTIPQTGDKDRQAKAAPIVSCLNTDDNQMMSPGSTTVPPQAMGTFTACGTMFVWVWKLGVAPRSHKTHAQFLHLAEIAHAAVDDDPGAAAAHEIGQHHLAEHAAGHVAARVHDDHVPRSGVVEHVPVQLALRVGVLVDLVEVLPLGHELQGQGRSGHRRARVKATGPPMWALRTPSRLSSLLAVALPAARRPATSSAGGRTMSGVSDVPVPEFSPAVLRSTARTFPRIHRMGSEKERNPRTRPAGQSSRELRPGQRPSHPPSTGRIAPLT